jgi:hypothetical protein
VPTIERFAAEAISVDAVFTRQVAQILDQLRVWVSVARA